MVTNTFGIVGVLAMALLSQEAFAQAAPAAPGAATSDAASTDADIGDIIVTAQRRGERLTDVPISVTALPATALARAGIDNIRDIAQMTPGLVFARQNATAQPTVRGIGSRGAVAGDESPVALYIDGVYQPLGTANLFEFNNVSQVEVLKGPQGTLFGRNATGGAITVNTDRPDRDEVKGKFTASYGNFNFKRVQGYISAPLSSTVSANLSVVALDDDGYVKNIFTNKREGDRSFVGLRAKIYYEPTDSLTFWVGGNYLKGHDNTPISQPYRGNSALRARNTPALNPLNYPITLLVPDEPFKVAGTIPYTNKVLSYGGDFHVNAELSFAKLTALVSGLRVGNDSNQDNDESPLVFQSTQAPYKSSSYTQEVILSSKDPGALQWLAGANGFQDRSLVTLSTLGNFVNINGQKTRAFSVFGEATYEVVENLFLTGGLRYSNEKRSGFYLPGVGADVTASKRYTSFSPRAVIRYKFNADSNIYASYSRGNKSGQFNANTPTGAATPINPEKIQAWEAGVKTRLPGGINFSGAGFYYKYSDLQVSVLNFVGGVSVSSSKNAGKVNIYGLEASLDGNIGGGFSVRTGVSYLNTDIVEFPNATVFSTVVPPLINGIPNTLPAGNVAGPLNVAGNEVPRSPHWTATAGINYNKEVSGGEFNVSVDGNYTDKYFAEFGNRISIPSYFVVNASIGFRAAAGWSFTVTGKNLANKTMVGGSSVTSLGDFVSYQAPRTVFATVGYQF